MRALLFFFLLFNFSTLTAQQGLIQTYVVDENQEGLPYVAIRTNGKGILSHINGYAQFPANADDQFCFEIIGYQKLCLNALDIGDTIQMKPQIELLLEVPIVADTRWLYDLVYACAQNMKAVEGQSRCYFQLESFRKGDRIERFEAYLNAHFQKASLAKLDWKQGRYALKPQKGSVPWLSTESSRAITEHSTLNNSDFFPKNILGLSKRQMRKHYQLHWTGQFTDENRHKKIHIDFEAITSSGAYFSGQLLIDSTQQLIDEVHFEIADAQTHPFKPLFPDDGIARVSMEIRKRFQPISTTRQLQSIDFNYELLYHSNKTKDQFEEFSIETRAVLYAFDFDSLFPLPHFDFIDMPYRDFRMAVAYPYAEDFWENVQEYRLRDADSDGQFFFEDPKNWNSRWLHRSDTVIDGQPLLEHAYRPWSTQRVAFSESHIESENVSRIPSERYKFVVQLYCDINEWNGELAYQTEAIFDPFQSFYHFSPTPLGNCFFNLYFDLVEIQRRKLDSLLQTAHHFKDAQRIYSQMRSETDELCKHYLKEVQRGENHEALRYWNTWVYEKLNINNLNYFNILQSEVKIR